MRAVNILGIDPGIARTGWGIIHYDSNSSVALAFDCIETKKNLAPESRLEDLYTSLKKILKKWRPKEAAVEKLFFNTNAKTALAVGEARGVTLLALKQEAIPVSQYTPLEVKMAVSGYGRADKHQVELMVKMLLNLKVVPSPDDVTDALAVAITHGVIKKPK